MSGDESLINMIMYRREHNQTCAQCADLCKATWTLTGSAAQRFCQSFTYDFNTGICDIFDVSDNQPAALAPYTGRAFFKPKTGSGCSQPACPEGTIRRLGQCRENSFEPRSAKVRETGLLRGVKSAPNPNSKGFGTSEAALPLGDANCWRVVPNAAVVNAVPFFRSSRLSYQDCAAQCAAKAKPPPPATEYGCLGFAFDHRWGICDLYAVSVTHDTAGNCYLFPYRGRDYVEPVPNCKAVTPIPTTTSKTTSRVGVRMFLCVVYFTASAHYFCTHCTHAASCMFGLDVSSARPVTVTIATPPIRVPVVTVKAATTLTPPHAAGLHP